VDPARPDREISLLDGHHSRAELDCGSPLLPPVPRGVIVVRTDRFGNVDDPAVSGSEGSAAASGVLDIQSAPQRMRRRIVGQRRPGEGAHSRHCPPRAPVGGPSRSRRAPGDLPGRIPMNLRSIDPFESSWRGAGSSGRSSGESLSRCMDRC
jgi:hypothetical protein